MKLLKEKKILHLMKNWKNWRKLNNGISIIGFMIYMGRKKYEYKNNFSYLTFIFGKVECKGTISNIDYSTLLKHVFK
jgi:hypothetical protein